MVMILMNDLVFLLIVKLFKRSLITAIVSVYIFIWGILYAVPTELASILCGHHSA